MKKILSVLLSVLLIFSAVSLIAFASEDDTGYTQIYTVRVSDQSKSKIEIVSVTGVNVVSKGANFQFTVKYLGSYIPDATTEIRVFPDAFPQSLFYSDEDTDGIVTLIPDEYGIYTIENVQEDMCVDAFSLNDKKLPSVKDLIVSIFESILNFIRRIFNLAA